MNSSDVTHKPTNPHGSFEWRRRRRLIYAALAFCFVAESLIVWAALVGASTPLLITLATAIATLAGAVLGSYVFGAAWHDKNVMQSAVESITTPTAEG